ncbi:hypothetical protein TNCV_830371 [Trichonephila clavipes]|nr:hypothetical protein TNCV_830371 [Trichonephila clavipes]
MSGNTCLSKGYPQSEAILKLKTQTQWHNNPRGPGTTMPIPIYVTIGRCPDLMVCLKRDLQCLRPQASLVLIYRPNVEGMKGRVDLAQPVNRNQELWCGSTIHYHSTLFGEK